MSRLLRHLAENRAVTAVLRHRTPAKPAEGSAGDDELRRLGLNSRVQENHLRPVHSIRLNFGAVDQLLDITEANHVLVYVSPNLQKTVVLMPAGDGGNAERAHGASAIDAVDVHLDLLLDPVMLGTRSKEVGREKRVKP